MALSSIASSSDTFQLLLKAFSLASSLRHPGMSDDQSERVEALVDPAFDALIAEPARSPSEVLSKAHAILVEYRGLDEIPAHLFAAIVGDLASVI